MSEENQNKTEHSSNSPDEFYNDILNIIYTYVVQVGCIVSIVALIAHLVIFYHAPTLKNIPAYILMSLSVAYLCAYVLVLTGLATNITGHLCVVSGILQQTFFLVSFLCMNAMAFNIWRKLKLATEQLIVDNQIAPWREYVFYTLYTWGIPILVSILLVMADNLNCIPEGWKPKFGADFMCTMDNIKVEFIFFAIPAVMVFIVNGVLFVLCALIIKRNKLVTSGNEGHQTDKLNFALYVRLAFIMVWPSMAYPVGIIAFVTNSIPAWLRSDEFHGRTLPVSVILVQQEDIFSPPVQILSKKDEIS